MMPSKLVAFQSAWVTVVMPPSALAAVILQSPVANKLRMLVQTAVPVFEPPEADVA